MVLCFIALPVFAVLSIFSVKYRQLTLEALDCVLRTATLRKCRSRLDDRIKSYITGNTLKISPKAAGFIYRNYKMLSWIVFALFIFSIYGSSIGIYNYVKYGNCNGPQETGFCVLDPLASSNCKISEANVDFQSEIVYPVLENNDPVRGSKDAQLTIIEFGCYSCEYTKNAEPIIDEVLESYNGKVNLQFKTFHLPQHPQSYQTALASDCAFEQNKYEQYHKAIFAVKEFNENTINNVAKEIGLDMQKFSQCMASEKYKDEVNADTLMGIHAHVKGTPTFFINNKVIAGPKPFKTFKTLIDEELKK